MKLSTKGRYAVMAMADLAHHSNGKPVATPAESLKQIAKPPKSQTRTRS